MIIFLSLIIALIGVLMYALSANGKLVEIGRIMFFCGLLTFLFNVGSATVSLLHR